MKFLIATHNIKKISELARVLKPLGIGAVSEKDLGISIDEVEETGTTFRENAKIKAEYSCAESGLPTIADDSGLEVDALEGAPGVYSARYAGENKTDEDRNKKLLEELADISKEKRTARFKSAICCVFPNGDFLEAEGSCEGYIGRKPLGDKGFGYDPVFIVDMDGEEKTFAQLEDSEKDKISHRGNALKLFYKKLENKLKDKDK